MTVWLANTAIRAMCNEAAARHPLESGGVLLGWRTGNSRVIVDILGPGPQALYGRYRFLPDHAWQVAQIYQRFEESHGDIDYLGDWHSHPDGEPTMSDEDSSTLQRISRRVRDPLMLILAGNTNRENRTISCWRGYLHRGLIRRRFEALAQTVKLFDLPSTWPVLASQQSSSK